ncbi:MAG TPA: hypothetical protein VFF69_08285 [Phycisphaerales bacterium]|nr:hypothetical protein [Phycisphaerales bacterium]
MGDRRYTPPDFIDNADDPFGTSQPWEYALEYWPTIVRNARALAAARALSHAMIVWRDGGPAAPLDIVRDALDASDPEVRITATCTLHRVVHAQDQPFHALIDLWNSVRAPGRAAMAWLAGLHCRDLSEAEELDFRARGLRDRSKVVRLRAADDAGLCRFAPILPLLRDVAANDPVETVRIEAEVARDLIEHGYHVFDADHPECISLVVIDTAGGGWSKCYTGVLRSEVARVGIDAAVAHVRRELEEEALEIAELIDDTHGER